MCKEAALQKELRALDFCSGIPIPGYYKSNKKYGLRKSKTYKGKPHKTHVKVFKRKYKDDRGRVTKCKCYICGKEGHFARDCRSEKGNMARAAVFKNMELNEDWDIVSADNDDKSTVYSISDGEQGHTLQNIGTLVSEGPLEETMFVLQIEEEDEEACLMFHPGASSQIHERTQKAGSWRPNKELPPESQKCQHEWEENGLTNHLFCFFCGIATTDRSRLHCPKCKVTSCALCAVHYLNKKVEIKKQEEAITRVQEREVQLLKELLSEKDREFRQMISDQATEYAEKMGAETQAHLKEEIRTLQLQKEIQMLKQVNWEQRAEIANIQKDYENQLHDVR